MIAEIAAALQSIKVLNELLKSARELNNFNEFNATVSEINAKLIKAQSAALLSQEKQASLSKRISELEEQIVYLKTWEGEKERYELKEVGRGVFAFVLKPGMEQGEPSHMLCADCYNDDTKSILQYEGGTVHKCPKCKTEIALG